MSLQPRRLADEPTPSLFCDACCEAITSLFSEFSMASTKRDLSWARYGPGLLRRNRAFHEPSYAGTSSKPKLMGVAHCFRCIASHFRTGSVKHSQDYGLQRKTQKAKVNGSSSCQCVDCSILEHDPRGCSIPSALSLSLSLSISLSRSDSACCAPRSASALIGIASSSACGLEGCRPKPTKAQGVQV